MKLQVLTTMTSASSGRWRQLMPALHELAHHDLAVDKILGAAETDESNFQGRNPNSQEVALLTG